MARSDVDQATAQGLTAKEFPNPTLALGVSRVPTDGTPSRTSLGPGYWNHSYDTNATVSQLLELGGKRRHRQGSASEGMRAAEYRFEDARRLLDGAVIKAYVVSLLTLANEHETARTAESLARSASLAGIRHRAGDISLMERNQVELAAHRFEEEALAAHVAALQARIHLDLLLGEPNPRGAWSPKDSLADLRAVLEPMGQTGSLRPDVLAAEAQLKKAQEEVALQQAQRIPDLTLSASYDHQPPDQRNTVGIGIGFTLPLWNRNRGAIAAARAVEQQARVDKARLEARVVSERSSAEAAFEAARHRSERFQTSLLPAAEQIRESVAFAYEKGAASYLELLEAERNATEVHLAAAQAQADALTSAVDLATALNSLPLGRP